jgi:hypothetical protein
MGALDRNTLNEAHRLLGQCILFRGLSPGAELTEHRFIYQKGETRCD